MDVLQLQALVKKSRLLSEADRAFWLSSISTMKPEHLTSLENLLMAGEGVPLKQNVAAYYATLRKNS